MNDQANQLRKLVEQQTASHCDGAAGPRLVVVCGGHRGVGVSTTAVNLAAALAASGLGVTLVDADPHGAGASRLCGLVARPAWADWLMGRGELSDVICDGPAGLHVVPGVVGRDSLTDYPPAAVDRWLAQFAAVGGSAEAVVVDAGNAPTRFVRRLWESAATIVVVVAGEPHAMLDTYAAVKTLGADLPRVTLRSFVNFAADAEAAAEAHARLAQACQRFLGLSLTAMGHTPLDGQLKAAGRAGVPLLHVAAESSAATEYRRAAVALSASWREVSVSCSPHEGLDWNEASHGQWERDRALV